MIGNGNAWNGGTEGKHYRTGGITGAAMSDRFHGIDHNDVVGPDGVIGALPPERLTLNQFREFASSHFGYGAPVGLGASNVPSVVIGGVLFGETDGFAIAFRQSIQKWEVVGRKGWPVGVKGLRDFGRSIRRTLSQEGVSYPAIESAGGGGIVMYDLGRMYVDRDTAGGTDRAEPDGGSVEPEGSGPELDLDEIRSALPDSPARTTEAERACYELDVERAEVLASLDTRTGKVQVMVVLIETRDAAILCGNSSWSCGWELIERYDSAGEHDYRSKVLGWSGEMIDIDHWNGGE